MSWFDDFIGGVSGSNWIAPLISGAATVTGAVMASNANREAADRASAGAQAQADAIRQGTALAQQRFETVQRQTQPAVDYQREVMAGADTLTPSQIEARKDVQRQTNYALSASGLRGSGRAAVAAVRKADTDFTNAALDANRRRADSAASGLSGQYFSANSQLASNDIRGGMATGAAANQQGLIGADYAVSDASLRGRAIGDIASLVNDTAKEGRKSNYRTNRPTESAQPTTMAGP
jgi:hypothetical protein